MSYEQDDNSSETTDEKDLLHAQILKNIRDCRRHYADWREEAKGCYDFYAGHQWSQEDIEILQSQGRPPVVFNRTARTINSVTGLEVQNRQEVTFFTRQLGNAGKSEMLTGAAKWARDECNAEDEESESFEDMIISGMGWTETRLDYETDPEGVILIERFDPLEGIVDNTAKKRNCEDSRFRGRLKTYSVSEYKERWPGKEVPKGRFFDSEEEERQVQDMTPAGYSPLNQDIPNSVKDVQVVQWQYYEIEKVRMVQDPSGQLREMPEALFKKSKDALDAAGMQYTRQSKPKRKYRQCFLNADEILEEDDCPVNDFTLHIITGLRDRNTNTWFGLVRPMQDPQRWANKWLSQIQHILNTQAKSGKLLWETGAFKNPRKAKEEWSSPDAMAELNAGGLEKVQQIPAAQYPDGVDRLLQYALSAINDVPGVNLELMGLANRDQANVLEQSRKQAGVTILAKFFDSLRRYRKKQGKVLAEYIQQYISDGRLIRIAGPMGAQYVPLIRDPKMLEYDVVVDDAPTSTNMKDKTFAALQTILPMVLQEQIPVPPDVLDYTSLPDDLIQKWKQYIQQQAQDPMKQQSQQLGMQDQQAEVQNKQADAQAKQSKAKLDEANALKIAHEISNPNNIEAQKAAADLQLKREQMQAEIQLKREEMAANNALKRDDMVMKHIVASESSERMAEASSKPTTKVQLGGDEVIGAIKEQLQNSNDAIANAFELNGQMMLQGFTMLGEKLQAGDEAIAKALSAPKVMKMKNSQGKVLTGEVSAQ